MKPIIEVNGLSKKYRLGEQQPYYTLRDSLAGMFKNPIAAVKAQLHKDEFWALKDINFTVQPGEVLGIIGRNGAGKSTLLKILSQITPPTEGEVILRGKVGSLLEVGTGFSPELTGRENIYLNGAILGMKRAEVKRKFDEIVAFSEVEKFLDTPLKRYSSGMYMRLAFAVAAHLEPDILIVDEVLAVGDAEFQKKCLGKMGEVAGEGRTALFVSHNMLAVRNLCSKCISIKQGSLTFSGETEKAIDDYLNSKKTVESQGSTKVLIDESSEGSGVRFTGVKIETTKGEPHVSSNDKLKITLSYVSDFNKVVSGARVVISIVSVASKQIVIRLDSDIAKNSINHEIFPQGDIVCSTDTINLIEGTYTVDIDLHIEGTRFNYVVSAAELNVQNDLSAYKYVKEPDSTVCDYVIPYSFKHVLNSSK